MLTFAAFTLPKFLTDLGVTNTHAMLAGVAAVIAFLYWRSQQPAKKKPATDEQMPPRPLVQEVVAPVSRPVLSLGELAMIEIERRRHEDEEIAALRKSREDRDAAMRSLIEPPKPA